LETIHKHVCWKKAVHADYLLRVHELLHQQVACDDVQTNRKEKNKGYNKFETLSIKGKEMDRKTRKEQKVMVSSSSTWTQSNHGTFETGTKLLA
jgi:hypothetical protein